MSHHSGRDESPYHILGVELRPDGRHFGGGVEVGVAGLLELPEGVEGRCCGGRETGWSGGGKRAEDIGMLANEGLHIAANAESTCPFAMAWTFPRAAEAAPLPFCCCCGRAVTGTRCLDAALEVMSRPNSISSSDNVSSAGADGLCRVCRCLHTDHGGCLLTRHCH